jgi:cell filamentation protein, protein adenylyltransferase
VISSQIEGTQATLVDLLAFEAEDEAVPNANVREVTNYLDALNYARDQLASKRGLPLSVRLLNEAHKRQMRRVRGSNTQPGEVRHSQNWDFSGFAFMGLSRVLFSLAVRVPPVIGLMPSHIAE